MIPNPRYRIVVPARRGSTRLPDKMLADLGGMPLLARVLQNAARAAGAAQIVAAVEDETLARAARAAGFLAVATDAAESGSARAAAACEKLGIADDEIIVNVQGDEPFIEPQIVAAVAARLAQATDCVCATAARPLAGIEEWRDANVVKVIADCDGRAMTFSRAPIPHPRAAADEGAPPSCARAHLGIYAYRAGFLRRFAAWPPSPPEICESLEQLRILWRGEKIALAFVESRAFGIDTAADLEAARARWAAGGD